MQDNVMHKTNVATAILEIGSDVALLRMKDTRLNGKLISCLITVLRSLGVDFSLR